jgi:hypothetical protein
MTAVVGTATRHGMKGVKDSRPQGTRGRSMHGYPFSACFISDLGFRSYTVSFVNSSVVDQQKDVHADAGQLG